MSLARPSKGSWWLKLEPAEQHFKALDQEISRYASSSPYEAVKVHSAADRGATRAPAELRARPNPLLQPLFQRFDRAITRTRRSVRASHVPGQLRGSWRVLLSLRPDERAPNRTLNQPLYGPVDVAPGRGRSTID